MAYAFRKKGQLYIGFIDRRGVRRRKRCRGTRSITEARELARKKEEKEWRIGQGLEVEVPEDPLFEEGAKLYLASLPKEYGSRDSVDGLFKNRILPHIGKKQCADITGATLKAMVNANADASLEVRRKLMVYVGACYRFLIEEAKLFTGPNPAKGKGMKVHVPKRTPKYLKLEDIGRLMDAIPDEFRLMAEFSLATGIRKGELLALRWTNLHLEEGFVHLERSNASDTTKGKRERDVPLPVHLIAELVELERVSKSVWVFPDKDGHQRKKWVKLHEVIRVALKKAGLTDGFLHMCRRKGCGHREESREADPKPCPKCKFKLWVEPIPYPIRWKELRSTWGTWAYSRTRDIAFVQKVLGHADPRTTQTHYAHALFEDIRAKAASLPFGGSPVGAVKCSLSHSSALGDGVALPIREENHPDALKDS